ncbi:MAG: DUF6448 family protein [Nitrospirota bacterium]
MKTRVGFARLVTAIIVCISIWFVPGVADAHCDTLDGPVIMTAKAALEKGDVTPVLKWVRKEDEPAIREMFKKTLSVRSKGPEARELADRYFFETLVRIHRAGEGAPYTGLQPAGSLEPSIAAADKALKAGSADHLVTMITDAAAKGIRERFAHVVEAKKHAEESVEAGRKFVEAYVDYTHYVERLHNDATAHHAHHGGPKKTGSAEHHH